jgi:hypothetical protein
MTPFVPPGTDQHKEKDQGTTDKQTQKSDKHGETSNNGRRF